MHHKNESKKHVFALVYIDYLTVEPRDLYFCSLVSHASAATR